jgi:hypothetical protein
MERSRGFDVGRTVFRTLDEIHDGADGAVFGPPSTS